MSQKTVQLLIGQLLTDEELRQQFLENPLETLRGFRTQGMELTDGEIEALVRTEKQVWTYAAKRIDPRLHRHHVRTE